MTKAKHVSRVITLALSMMMVIAMAVPAFAAQPQTVTPRISGSFSYYRPYTVFDSRMGIVGAIGDGTAVNLRTSSLGTRFKPTYAADGSYRIFSEAGFQSTNLRGSYTLNAYRSGNWPCTMLQAADNNRMDSEININSLDSSGYSFRIVLYNHGKYLTQNGLNQPLTWGPYAEAYTKAWVNE